MKPLEPSEFCRAAIARLLDWDTKDQAAVGSLLMHFARMNPSEPLFLESLRALARDTSGSSLAAAAGAVFEAWREAQRLHQMAAEPIQLRPDDRPDIRAELQEHRRRKVKRTG